MIITVPNPPAVWPNTALVGRFLKALVPGAYEIRIPEPRKPRFWKSQAMYLRLPDDLEVGVHQIAGVMGGHAAGVYIVGNPVNPALLGRGRAAFHHCKSLASDADVSRRRLLYIDIDPVRASGINANADETAAAMERTTEAVGWLAEELEFPPPLFHGTSGSGGMLLYRIDLPNDDAATAQVSACLSALSDSLSDGRVKIDTGVYNAARIFRVPGTVNAKSNTPQPDRPWTLVTGTLAGDEVSNG